MNRDDAETDRLLARGDLGGPRYDEILQRVLERTAPPAAARTWSRRRLLIPLTALVAGFAAWVVFVGPDRDHFTPKGDRDSDAIAVGCRFPGGECRPGEKLVFTVNGALTHGYLGAYAERVDDPSHHRIWYFPTAAGTSPLVAPGSGTQVVPQGIEISQDHPPGRYRVNAWISSRPLDRLEADDAPVGLIKARATVPLEIRR